MRKQGMESRDGRRRQATSPCPASASSSMPADPLCLPPNPLCTENVTPRDSQFPQVIPAIGASLHASAQGPIRYLSSTPQSAPDKAFSESVDNNIPRRGPHSGLHLESKPCAECGQPFSPRRYESWSAWATRKCCSPRCGRRIHYKDVRAARYEKVLVNGRERYTHRAIVESILGRSLDRKEIVHHKDGDRTNNHPDNLEIMSQSAHAALHFRKYPATGECERCGAEYRRNGKMTRRFCSNSCAAFYREAVKRGRS